MPEIECCYDFGTCFCKNKVEFWVTRKYDAMEWWFGFCKEHLDLIIDTNEIVGLEQLQKASPRMYKRAINWEELGYHPKIHTFDKKSYGDIKITIALKEYRKRKLQKYINKRKSVMGEISENVRKTV